MADSAIDSVRRFSAEWEQSSDRLAAAAMAGQPYDGGTLTLKLDIDGAAKERFDATIDYEGAAGGRGVDALGASGPTPSRCGGVPRSCCVDNGATRSKVPLTCDVVP